MQINKLIEMEELEEAHLNLLSLRQEFQEEQCGEVEGSMEQSKKEKDLQLLYRKLRDKVKTIVRDSSSLPSRNKGHLVSVARLVQEEERSSPAVQRLSVRSSDGGENLQGAELTWETLHHTTFTKLPVDICRSFIIRRLFGHL